MSALVILSGGADSTISALVAMQKHSEVHAVTFNYGQRHSIEIEGATAIASALNLASHEIIDCQGILASTSPLTSSNPVERYSSPDEMPGGIANTFVPARNLFFLTVAANRAIALGCDEIYTGVCQTDFSGYPDCRRDFIDSVEIALFAGLEQQINIITPLMHLTKAESVLMGLNLLRGRFNEVMSLTHTCYEGIRGGCGKCAACLLRDRGFKDAGIDDPIWKLRNDADAVQ